jgi:hypothetical protein
MPKHNPYRALMSERRETTEMLAIFGSFRLGIQGGEHQDRAAVLVCVSLLEQALEDAIWTHAVDHARDERNRFFTEGQGVATSLADKIFLAYVLGVIGPKIRADLSRIRQVRNVFAHARRHIDFGNDEIVKMCAFGIADTKLWKRLIGKSTPKPREAFVLAVQLIAEGFIAPGDELKQIMGE